MNRRKFIAALAGASIALPSRSKAQQARKVPMIGFLHPGFPDAGAYSRDALQTGIREAGYTEGETIQVAARWAQGRPEMLPQLAQELIRLRVDLLVATARSSIEAAKAATTSIPIVANDLESDPVASGYVASLAHPGGNITGVFLDAPTLCGKWLQQLRDLVPNLTKIAVLWDATTGTYQLDAIKMAAKTTSIEFVVMDFGDNRGLEAALDLGLKEAPQAVIQLGSPLIRQAASHIAQILSGPRIPAISQFREFPDGGGLISYGPDLKNLYQRVGIQVARVLRGTHPSDLPIERPTKFELVINLKAAKAFGLTVPPNLLASADEVIE